MAREKQTALITGASSGIGLELARVFAEHGHDVALVARREDRLRELAAELERDHGVRTHVFTKDLSRTEAPGELFEECTAHGLTIDVLVNNAGYGAWGPFAELDRDYQAGIVDVNLRATVTLTHLFVGGMLERGRGRILNLGSVTSFQPSPKLAVYAASKAFVLSFSEALATEFEGTGVTVTALCPGATETEFGSAADMERSLLWQLNAMSAPDVARAGYDATMAGTDVVVPGIANRVTTQLAPLLPRRWVRWFVDYLAYETND